MTSPSIAFPLGEAVAPRHRAGAAVRVPFFRVRVDCWRPIGSWSLTGLELPLSSLGVVSIKGITDDLLAGDVRGAFTWALVMLGVESVIMVRGDSALRWNNRMRYFTGCSSAIASSRTNSGCPTRCWRTRPSRRW